MNKKSEEENVVYYLTSDHIVKLNKLAIKLFVNKKADKHEVFYYSKIYKTIDDCEEKVGDIYDKAVVLLKGLVKVHAFASGNRRTALLATYTFLTVNKQNKHNIYISDNPSDSRTLIGIREDYYTDKEIKSWLRDGKIKKFKR